MDRNQKRFRVSGLTVIIGLCVVIIVSMLFLMASGTTKQSQDSKTNASVKQTTYTDTRQGFSVTFPSTYTLYKNKARVRGTNTFHDVDRTIEIDAKASQPTPSALISYSDTQPDETLDNYIQTSSECDDVEQGKGESFTLSGIPAKRFSHIHCGDAAETRVYVLYKSTIYTLTFREDAIPESVASQMTQSFTLK
jgi:hypothetical protein